MGKKHKITDPSEIHKILLEKYQKSSANIVVRVMIDRKYAKQEYGLALKYLASMHPYINAKYSHEKDFGYFYEEINACKEIVLHDKDDFYVEHMMESLSQMRTYLFNHSIGELFALNVVQGSTKSIIELTCSHILGEVHSIIMIMGEYIKILDGIHNIDSLSNDIHEKYFFQESDFGWGEFKYKNLKFTEPKENHDQGGPWILPQAIFRRYKLPIKDYIKIKGWLSDNKIQAKVSDFFYYVANEVLTEFLGRSPDLWVIVNYRNKAKTEKIKNSAYNFGFFSSVDTSAYDRGNIKNWLESFFRYRSGLVTEKGVFNLKNMFYSLNLAMENKEIGEGKKIMNSIVRFPDFAFNNFGEIDHYIGQPNNFKIIDFDIQDGTPSQEIRYFYLNGNIYMNPTFFEGSGIDADGFWTLFNDKTSLLSR